MLLREQLTSSVSGLLLENIRDNGWLTAISNDAGINRSKLNKRGLAKMPLDQLVRLLVAISYHNSRRSSKMFYSNWCKLGQFICQVSENHYDELCNERRR
jgi:hypothetical protein